MGRVASSRDNAAMESFFSLLQKNVLMGVDAGDDERPGDIGTRCCHDDLVPFHARASRPGVGQTRR